MAQFAKILLAAVTAAIFTGLVVFYATTVGTVEVYQQLFFDDSIMANVPASIIVQQIIEDFSSEYPVEMAMIIGTGLAIAFLGSVFAELCWWLVVRLKNRFRYRRASR